MSRSSSSLSCSSLSLTSKRCARVRVCAVFFFVVLAFVQTTIAQRAYIPDPNDPHAFNVDFKDPVALHVAASSSYQIDSDIGAQEWAALVPPGPRGHLVNVKDDTSDPTNSSDVRPYTVTLFHQLKCLDVIRRQYLLPLLPPTPGAPEDENRTPPVRPITRHCMNYLRQTILCRPSLWLESAKNVLGTATRTYDAVCRDWEEVYAAVERNQASFRDGREL